MKFGVVTSFGSVHDYLDMARDAEASGWDGVFAWDDISVERGDVFDPWVVLGGMAAVTSRITLGAMVFSLARRRPWKVARETITIDNLSNGRFVLPVGLGGTWDGGYSRVSTDDPSRRVRAEKLDECLEILELAWSGETVSYHGRHYWMKDLLFDPRPVQRPRIPVWPVGAWPFPKSLGRAARWDGIIVSDLSDDAAREAVCTPVTAVAGVAAWMAEHRRSDGPFDIIAEGVTSGTDHAADRATVEPLAAAGATWFIESRWDETDSVDTVRERIRRGPPRI
jgi:alkanesulfonate monooxygenase SsuD/methylene tetrahydromethanopterin reductase-like flavin-dependent oxidoreductase (luciferase family)